MTLAGIIVCRALGVLFGLIGVYLIRHVFGPDRPRDADWGAFLALLGFVLVGGGLLLMFVGPVP